VVLVLVKKKKRDGLQVVSGAESLVKIYKMWTVALIPQRIRLQLK